MHSDTTSFNSHSCRHQIYTPAQSHPLLPSSKGHVRGGSRKTDAPGGMSYVIGSHLLYQLFFSDLISLYTTELSARRSTIDGKFWDLLYFSFFTHSSSSDVPGGPLSGPFRPPFAFSLDMAVPFASRARAAGTHFSHDSTCLRSRPTTAETWQGVASNFHPNRAVQQREGESQGKSNATKNTFGFLFSCGVMEGYYKTGNGWEKVSISAPAYRLGGLCVLFSLLVVTVFFFFCLPQSPCLAFTAGCFPCLFPHLYFLFLGWVGWPAAKPSRGSAWLWSRMFYQRRDSLPVPCTV
ncbi:hypothetical protein EDB81DRAFT_399264 [Dactylonectria macrodidyma]|uniref:Transmembrane protein n=1 Tax=Dactylonectria macrodidyma TaxID=307937 RepID=A0A9P9FAB6_9HYPO|nr:hypothetical protein EDB81DRAFT_399264 [Dactylonectria macrodidyma]